MEGEIIVKDDPKESAFWISAHELRIIEAIVDGKTSKEIALERGVSYKTVEVHRHNVMKRLKCRNMPQMVGKLFRQKILT